jgi:hypothetical protein
MIAFLDCSLVLGLMIDNDNEDADDEAAGVDGFGKDMVRVAPIDESVE